jgi:hypothetical protein
MKGHGEKQSRKQDAAIIALLAYPTIPEAAKACGVGETTLWRWLQDPDFQVAYRQARRQVVEKAIVELQRACSDAVKTLTRNLNCGQPAVEVSAAKVILDQATKGVELSDLVERVEQLESLLIERQEGKGKKCA